MGRSPGGWLNDGQMTGQQSRKAVCLSRPGPLREEASGDVSWGGCGGAWTAGLGQEGLGGGAGHCLRAWSLVWVPQEGPAQGQSLPLKCLPIPSSSGARKWGAPDAPQQDRQA